MAPGMPTITRPTRPSLGQPGGVFAEASDVVAVGQRQRRCAVFPRHVTQQRRAEARAGLAEAALTIDDGDGALALLHTRPLRRQDDALFHLLHIGLMPQHAVRIVTVEVGAHQRPGDEIGDVRWRAGGLVEAAGEVGQFGRSDDRHG